MIPRVLLRDDLLHDRRIGVADAALAAALAAFHADVHPDGSELDALVVDAAAPFAGGGLDGLRAALDETWETVRETALAAWIPDGPGGAVILLGPRPGAGPHAEAARAGLENMARTLSIEWARFGIRPVALLPGDDVPDDDVTTLVAYLASSAGDYFSGTALTPE